MTENAAIRSTSDEEDLILGRVLRRYITEEEMGYGSPAYIAVLPAYMTLDGKVKITSEELEVIVKILKEV